MDDGQDVMDTAGDADNHLEHQVDKVILVHPCKGDERNNHNPIIKPVKPPSPHSRYSVTITGVFRRNG